MERVDYEKLIVQDLINMHKNGELNLSPWYQRRSVWTQPQKAYLINTLLEQKPIPSLYVRHSLDLKAEKSIREVVDGQQRIRAVLDFVNDQFAVKHPAHPRKVKYTQLSPSQMQTFKLTSLSVGYLLGATEEDVIEIFGRLNSVSKSLNAQEKRNAKYSGEFKQFCLRQAAVRLPLWRELNIFSAGDIARMDEFQFVSDLALNVLNGLSDYSPAKLDKIYKDFDEEFPNLSELESVFERTFAAIAKLKSETIRDTVFSRPPLFFSLFLILAGAKRSILTPRLEAAINKIDDIVGSDRPIGERSKDEAEFLDACKASTQRIRQRQIRENFIRTTLGL